MADSDAQNLHQRPRISVPSASSTDDQSPRIDSDAISPHTLPARLTPVSAATDQPTATSPRVRYDSSVGAQTSPFPRLDSRHRSRDASRMTFSPSILRRRSNRAATFRTVDGANDDLDLPFHPRLGWQPGAEPGFDPALPDGGHASMPTLSARCEITVVDYSLEKTTHRHFDNESFIEFLQEPKESWAKCRWININGLSWDVIQAVGATKKLHKLALEDIMNVRNRTKADW